MTEEAKYRAIRMDSSSSLKDFSFDKKKYYKKYFLNEIVEEKDTIASVMGRIVETLLLEPELFDSRFYLSSCASTPTGLMNDFVEALYKYTKQATNENGEIINTFENISKSAYIDSGFKIKYEAVLNKFLGSDAEFFYNEILNVRANNLTVITMQEVTNAENIVEELKNNFVTKEIINLKTNNRYIVYNQYQIEGYDVDGHFFKSMIDKIIVDKEKQEIKIYDLKCTWSVENFDAEYYLYRRAYIQAYLYYRACQSLTENKEHEFFGYIILPPQFIVCDSINYYNPLIYTLSLLDLKDAYLGFNYRDKDYPGVKTLIEELNWAIENNIWNISKKHYIKQGIINIKD